MVTSKVTHAIFLAAGLGSRLRPYTLTYPKPMIPFLELPLLFHAMDFLTEYSEIKSGIVNLHHHGEELRQFISQYQSLLPVSKIDFSDEQVAILDSGGAVANCYPLLADQKAFWVMNADEVIMPLTDEFSLKGMIQQHLASDNLATLLVTHNDQVGITMGGAWADDTGRVEQFSKTNAPGLRGWHYVGVMLLSPRIFEYVTKPTQPENILYDVLTRAISKGEKVQAFSAPLFWIETGLTETFLQNQAKVQTEIDQKSPLGQLFEARLKRYPKFAAII